MYRKEGCIVGGKALGLYIGYVSTSTIKQVAKGSFYRDISGFHTAQ